MGNQFIQSCDVASKNRRFANYILDTIFIRMLAFPVWFLIGLSTSVLGITDAAFWKSLDNPAGELFIGCVTVFVYYFLCEALWQRTLAKLITGTKVVTINGTKPPLDAIGMRTLLRFIPFEPLSFLTKKAGGWHDRWSGTVVVRTQAAQSRQPQPLSYPVANAQAVQDRKLQPLNYPAVNAEAVQDHKLQPLNYPVAKAEATQDRTPQPLSDPVVNAEAVQDRKFQPLTYPVVNADATQDRQPQPLGDPVVNANSAAPNMGIPSCEPVAQRAIVLEPTCTAVAASKTSSIRGTGLGGKATWLVIAGAIAVLLGVFMMRSASRPVESASASNTFDQTDPVYVPPTAPSADVPSSAPSVPVPSPAPTPASVPSGLPPAIQVQAVVVANGKTVVYSDIGELAEGRTVSGWKVVRITGREIVLKNGDAVHTYPLSRPDTGSN